MDEGEGPTGKYKAAETALGDFRGRQRSYKNFSLDLDKDLASRCVTTKNLLRWSSTMDLVSLCFCLFVKKRIRMKNYTLLDPYAHDVYSFVSFDGCSPFLLLCALVLFLNYSYMRRIKSI